MIAKEIIFEKYKELNKLAEQGGVVIFGGCKDRDIAMCELKQAFFPNTAFYNRSFDGISITNATDIYSICVAPLVPDTVLLHIGMDDLKLCSECPAEFEMKFRELISKIRENNKKCDIAIINFKNDDSICDIEGLNKHLKYIADSEHCTYCDISNDFRCNSLQKKKELSFIYDLGFVKPLKHKHPVFDMAEVLFCCE